MNEQSPLEAIFFAALEKSTPQGRAAFLDDACALDPDLRRRVEKMLAAQAKAASFLEKPAAQAVATVDESIPESAGSVIGTYKLLKQIGEGGFGVVFMSEQKEPVRRRVAIKVLKPGMDNKQVIARFEAERQALAIMDHPNIAKFLDAGQTNSGRPYFVMDLVKGLPITEYCDEARLTPKERLEIFVHVCRAVQHAHQKGIIHRDIKPSNVLVTTQDGPALVKVIDFGIAKALGQQLTDKTLFTGLAQLIGTPLYMSPEQATLSNVDVDTRSDIYSLGVLLYELLTGTTPFDKVRLGQVGYDEMLRIIREEEPPKPSTRINAMGKASTTISTHRKSDPKRLSHLFRGELDWIVMKALEKDRNRRFETASAFAADVQHFLRDEPVEACPPSAGYRMRKFVRRHRGALAIAAGLLLVCTSVVGSIGLGVRDRMMSRIGMRQKSVGALEEAGQKQKQRQWPDALAAIHRAEAFLPDNADAELIRQIQTLNAEFGMVLRLEEIPREPRLNAFSTINERSSEMVDAQVADVEFASAFREFGIDIESLEVGEAAKLIKESSIAEQLALALDEWAGAHRKAGKEGDATWTKLLAIARNADSDPLRSTVRDALWKRDRQQLEKIVDSLSFRDTPPGTLVLLGQAFKEAGALDKAIALLRNAQQRFPNDVWINDVLASTYMNSYAPPQYDEAFRFYSCALSVRPQNYRLHTSVAQILNAKRIFDEAVAQFSRAIELKPDYLDALLGRGGAYFAQGQRDKALADLSKAIELHPLSASAWETRAFSYYYPLSDWHNAIADISRAIELDPNNNSLAKYHNRGTLYLKIGDWKKAEADFSIEIDVRPRNLTGWFHRAEAREKMGQWDKAIEDYSRAIELNPSRFGPQTVYWQASYRRGLIYHRLGQWEKAIADLSEYIKLEPNFAHARRLRVDANERLGRLAATIDDYSKLIELNPKDGQAWQKRSAAFWASNQYQKALADAKRAADLEPTSAAYLNNLAWILATVPDPKLRETARAVEIAEKAVQLAPNDGSVLNTLGVAHYRAGSWNRAIEVLTKSVNLMNGQFESYNSFFLAMAHWRLGEKENARKWCEQAVSWMEKNQPKDEELRRFRKEAVDLIGIPDKPKGR
jgi:serine/threonine protein kinase/tetratricopeptide (TPR) repeat protein